MQESLSPDRPISEWLLQIRRVIRKYRILKLQLRLGKKFEIGRNVVIGANSTFLPPDYAIIGNNVYIGKDFHLESNLTVGNDVLISSRVAIVGNDHRFDDESVSIIFSGRNPVSCVQLEGDNLVGFGSIIVGSVVINRGCIIGAGSVVVDDLPPNMVCVGVPAKPVKRRY